MTPPESDANHAPFMQVAVEEARRALEHDDVPVGAVIVRAGAIVAKGHNEREGLADATAHAELLAIRRACRTLGRWRLSDCALYVTLEPCAMCAGALVLCRIGNIVYGAPDPKAGACGSVLDVTGDARLNHNPPITAGVLADECGELLREFFRSRRGPRD
jgi:tRNA(adenine34) deaminase